MLDRALVEEVLVAARRRGGSFAELFVEERSNTSVRLDDGKVEELTTGLDRGAGVRVARGTSYGYAFSNRLDRDALLNAAAAASALAAARVASWTIGGSTVRRSATSPGPSSGSEATAADAASSSASRSSRFVHA